jgi:hypothetical protein
MSLRATTHRLWTALLFTVVLTSAALVLSPSAVARWGGEEPCVSSNGLTLKQQYGYSVAIVTRDRPQIRAAERWAPSAPWIMNTRFEQMPSGFVTDFSTPLDDIRGKLQTVEYVVDAGSPYQFNNRSPATTRSGWVSSLMRLGSPPSTRRTWARWTRCPSASTSSTSTGISGRPIATVSLLIKERVVCPRPRH